MFGACLIIDNPLNLVYYDQLGNQEDPIFLTVNKLEQEEIQPEGRTQFYKYFIF